MLARRVCRLGNPDWTDNAEWDDCLDDGTFALQSTQASFEGYLGMYTEANGLITFFRWQHDPRASAAWPPATGTIDDDSLTVRYDPIMLMDDFEDAVYMRTVPN